MKLQITAVCAGLVLTGCGGGAAPVAAPSSTSPSPSASSTAPSATPTPTPTPSPKTTFKVGQTYKGPEVNVTVQQIVVNKRDSSDQLYSGALVKTCVHTTPPEYKNGFWLGWGPWALYDADGGRYPDNGTVYGSSPRPIYPNGEQDGIFKEGECAKGWMFFDVPSGTKIVSARYQAEGMVDAITWRR
ncbi:hypothetical protein ACK8HX_02245 [Oryzobacter sp. R7]|uniref:hypothetical protein n=1 Tax=Oryzobacter faecalis TaxID=3388656 RepID=UPI00398C9404